MAEGLTLDSILGDVAQYFIDCRANAAKGSAAERRFATFIDAVHEARKKLKAQERKWIPFVKRQLTEDEQKNHPEWCYILDGEVPDDGQEILVYRPWRNKEGYIITMETYYDNGDEVYLDGAMDIENGMYWMPLPEPPKEETI